jgi:hypothetical protein
LKSASVHSIKGAYNVSFVESGMQALHRPHRVAVPRDAFAEGVVHPLTRTKPFHDRD